jgi:hypothetical protein
MYLNLSAKFTDFDRDDPKIIVQYYRVNDTTFRHDFSATYVRNRDGSLNDIHHIDQILTAIYYAYKFSKQSLCKNFGLVIEKTFPHSVSMITKTKFYTRHKVLVDKSLERK